MKKLKPDDLKKIKAGIQGALYVNRSNYKAKITVHMGTCGLSAGAAPVMEALRKELDKSGAKDINLTSSGCPGLCSREPMVTVERKGQDAVKYVYVDAEKARVIFKEHVLNGKIINKHALSLGTEAEA